MQATLVHNATAGTGNPSAEELVEILEDAGYSLTSHSAKDENLPKILARAPGLVIAAGGDGTIARVITQMKDREKRIAILPLGTANNIAHAFGITGPVEAIVAGWEHGREQKMDIGMAKGPFEPSRFLESVGVGALANVTTKKIKEEGTLAKQVENGRDAFRKVLRKAKPIKVKVRIDDRPVKHEVLLLEIMNIGFVGPNLRLGPEADAADGRLDAIFVPADLRKEILEWIEEPERRAAPVVAESGRSIVLEKNGALLRVGDKTVAEAEGEIIFEVEHPGATLLLPSTPVKRTRKAVDPNHVESGDSA